MKNQNYYVLKTIYRLTRKNNSDFVPLSSLLSKNCPDSVVTYLEFRHFLNYKRENKTDYYSITQKGIEYLCQYKRDRLNLAASVVAAAVSLIGLLKPICGLLKTLLSQLSNVLRLQ
jgi:hypothetical protein